MRPRTPPESEEPKKWQSVQFDAKYAEQIRDIADTLGLACLVDPVRVEPVRR